MSVERLKVKPEWKEAGAALIIDHPDDELLFWKMTESLC